MWFHPDFKSFFLHRYLSNSIVKKKPLEDTSSHKQPSLKVTHQSNKFDYFPLSISGDCVSAGHKGLFKRASLINTVSVRTVMLLSRCITTPWQGNSFSKVHATSVRRLCKICPICPTATARRKSWGHRWSCTCALSDSRPWAVWKCLFFLCAANICICACVWSLN